VLTGNRKQMVNRLELDDQAKKARIAQYFPTLARP
jgi:hypothetical protein